MADIEYGLLKKLFENGAISEKTMNSAINKTESVFENQAVEQSKLPAHKFLDSVVARYADGDSELKNIGDRYNTAMNGKNPYEHVGGPLPTFPNESFKITTPMQHMGEPGISEPFNSKRIDPFPWMDSKYEHSKKILSDAKEAGIPVTINTSSDLIARDDYHSLIPEGSKINIYGMTGNEHLNRLLFVGNPSNKRLEAAAEKLKSLGHDVSFIKPTEDDIMEALKNHTSTMNVDKKVESITGLDADAFKEALREPGVTKPPIKLLGLGFGAAEGLKSPLDYISQGMNAYEGAKDKAAGFLAKQMSGGNPYAEENLKTVAGIGLDPMNLIDGPAGAGLAAIQGMGLLAQKMKQRKSPYE